MPTATVQRGSHLRLPGPGPVPASRSTRGFAKAAGHDASSTKPDLGLTTARNMGVSTQSTLLTSTKFTTQTDFVRNATAAVMACSAHGKYGQPTRKAVHRRPTRDGYQRYEPARPARKATIITPTTWSASSSSKSPAISGSYSKNPMHSRSSTNTSSRSPNSHTTSCTATGSPPSSPPSSPSSSIVIARSTVASPAAKVAAATTCTSSAAKVAAFLGSPNIGAAPTGSPSPACGASSKTTDSPSNSPPSSPSSPIAIAYSTPAGPVTPASVSSKVVAEPPTHTDTVGDKNTFTATITVTTPTGEMQRAAIPNEPHRKDESKINKSHGRLGSGALRATSSAGNTPKAGLFLTPPTPNEISRRSCGRVLATTSGTGVPDTLMAQSTPNFEDKSKIRRRGRGPSRVRKPSTQKEPRSDSTRGRSRKAAALPGPCPSGSSFSANTAASIYATHTYTYPFAGPPETREPFKRDKRYPLVCERCYPEILIGKLHPQFFRPAKNDFSVNPRQNWEAEALCHRCRMDETVTGGDFQRHPYCSEESLCDNCIDDNDIYGGRHPACWGDMPCPACLAAEEDDDGSEVTPQQSFRGRKMYSHADRLEFARQEKEHDRLEKKYAKKQASKLIKRKWNKAELGEKELEAYFRSEDDLTIPDGHDALFSVSSGRCYFFEKYLEEGVIVTVDCFSKEEVRVTDIDD